MASTVPTAPRKAESTPGKVCVNGTLPNVLRRPPSIVNSLRTSASWAISVTADSWCLVGVNIYRAMAADLLGTIMYYRPADAQSAHSLRTKAGSLAHPKQPHSASNSFCFLALYSASVIKPSFLSLSNSLSLSLGDAAAEFVATGEPVEALEGLEGLATVTLI